MPWWGPRHFLGIWLAPAQLYGPGQGQRHCGPSMRALSPADPWVCQSRPSQKGQNWAREEGGVKWMFSSPSPGPGACLPFTGHTLGTSFALCP